MATTTLYDFSPLARLMIMGVVVALGPLAWIWLRKRQQQMAQRLHALTVLTLFLTFDLVLFGAFTRLTDSGLGCPDWPGCYGHASPVGAVAQISAAQAALPSGPVTHGKAWVEMIHRYLATGVGVLILTLTAVTWYERRRRGRAVNPWWPTLTLFWVMLQGAFGALTVTMKLFPLIVTLHLIGGLVLLALLSLQAVRYQQADPAWRPVAAGVGLRRVLALALAALSLQVALGGWVSTNYAVMACSDFPLCQGSAWPVMDFDAGFSLWRELGLTRHGDMLPFAALTAIHFTHRLAALAVLAALALAAWRLNGVPALRGLGRWLAALAVLQLLTGLSNAVLEWPLLAAVMHTGGAAAMVVVLVRAWVVTSAAPLPQANVGRVAGVAA